LQNPGFRNDFINRFADLMNTSFLTSRVLGKIDEMKAQIAAEMPEVFARWEAPLDDDDWNYFIDVEKDFANQRPACQRNHIRSKFGIASNINATLDVDDVTHGYIKMNTIDIKQGTPGITAANPYPWTGIYFSGIPVTVKAIANPGFVFSNWTGSVTSTDAEITTTQTAAFNLTAHFVPAVVSNPEPIYFWMMNSAIPNDTPLESLATTFEAEGVDGVIQYQSCLVGYPFTAADPNWRTASMERRNSPTPINYIPEANGNIVYSAGIMKGLQITEPLENNGLGNTMVFNFSTAGYKDIKFSFAAMNELTNATGILVDYSINAGAPVWITTGLAATSLPLSAAFQLFEVDFTSITTVNDNANFKIRLRFEGANMTVSAGNRITFNNIAVIGTQAALGVKQQVVSKFTVYPNPFSDVLNISGINGAAYKIFSIDGKLVKYGNVETTHINLGDLSKGMYLLQLTSDGNTETKKIIKK
ncbi:MAG TPA: T9SS type A sorting domain-containing protein, partial [Flavobacterium sp.]|nr:T9SS type A sorting domain-containing protein [Flavobacterium sp.]